MGLVAGILKDVWMQMLPWSAAHVTNGKLMSMSESVYYNVGFKHRFKEGDFVFGRTVLQGKQYPVIYVVKAIREYMMDPTIDLVWELRLLGGYGPKELDIKYASGTGESPYLTYAGYFRDQESQSWRPKLNYYAEKVVRGGKTIWDIDQKLMES